MYKFKGLFFCTFALFLLFRINKAISPYNLKMNKLITLLFCLSLPAYVFADTLTGKVIKITDGDTVHVLRDNHTKKIRLAGD